jgi:hypothetical protein
MPQAEQFQSQRGKRLLNAGKEPVPLFCSVDEENFRGY